jgi:molybdopterin-containing oxidoreductase family iron-sulfur binding subunit
MVIDLDRCTGCQSCSVACRTENNVPACGDQNAWKGRAIFWNKVIAYQVDEKGVRHPAGAPYEERRGVVGRVHFLPLPCMHCERSPCTKLCPVRATMRSADGIVTQVPSRCIGCRLCQAACAYSRRYFNWQRPEYRGDLKQAVNPDVAVRTLGVIEKCTFCVHRLQKAREQARAEEREVLESDYVPACVESCPAKARVFGDLDNPTHRAAKLATSARAFRLLPELGTDPKVIYLKEAGWQAEEPEVLSGDDNG